MIALDTSVVVPALLRWHEAHNASRRAAAHNRIPAHVLVETFSVLTRLPAPHRMEAGVAGELLAGWFADDAILVPSARLARAFVKRLTSHGIDGGSSYDGIVALTAAEHRAELLTRDLRAARTYEALGVDFRILDA